MENYKDALQLHMDLGLDDLFSSKPESIFEKSKTFLIVRRKKQPGEITHPSSAPSLTKNKDIIQETTHSCESIKTLEELRKSIENFKGSDLQKMATNLVFCDGNPQSPIMIIGEAPGADEDMEGKPFVGMSGKLLDKMFKTIDLTREKNLYITNILPYRPPGNRTPTPFEMAMFRPFVIKHIELIAPKILILVGATALKTILQKDLPITQMHGQWNTLTIGGLNILTTAIYHPAYVLRSPIQKRMVWQDLLKIKEQIAFSL